MKTLTTILATTIVFACLATHAQGTFIYDQQSSATENLPAGFVLQFQEVQPFGQSFVPTLSSINTVRIYIGDYVFPNGPGATIEINLLSDSITGPVMASTMPVFMPGGFYGYTNFFFPSSVPIVPGTTYYLQPVATSGNPVTAILPASTYANGTLYRDGAPWNSQLWFREGIIVPEPSVMALLLVWGLRLLARASPRCEPVRWATCDDMPGNIERGQAWVKPLLRSFRCLDSPSPWPARSGDAEAGPH